MTNLQINHNAIKKDVKFTKEYNLFMRHLASEINVNHYNIVILPEWDITQSMAAYIKRPDSQDAFPVNLNSTYGKFKYCSDHAAKIVFAVWFKGVGGVDE
jgi:hypothetical protein